MNIGTKEDFKEYLLYIKTYNDSLTEKQKEGFMICDKYFPAILQPSDEGYYDWYINNKL